MGKNWARDLPTVKATMGDTPKRVTLVLPYYENPEFFERQYDHLGSLAWSLPEQWSVIVVDDGSPKNPLKRPVPVSGRVYLPESTLRIFRIEHDVRWNWLAARNIGAHHASNGWLLMTDMDHVVPEATLRSLVYGQHDPSLVYFFNRAEHTGEVIGPHSASFFLTREMFWKIGGYDEALSGHYGTDGVWRAEIAKTAPMRLLTDYLVRYEYVGDSSTTTYKRKQPQDAAVSRLVKARGKDWKPKTLSFPYHEVTA